MATKQVPKIVQTLGNIPAHRATFYTDNKKPELSLESGQRVSYLRYKTDKETNTLRSSMAVIVFSVTRSEVLREDKGAEFLDALIAEKQDDYIKRAAEGSVKFDGAELASELIRDYFDNSRTANGTRVTGEQVGSFFDSALASWLMDRIVAKFPNFEADKVAKVVEQYRASFADLSKYSLPHSKQVTEMIAKAWAEFTSQESYEDSDLGDWIGERIKKLQDRHNAQEMLVDAI